MFFIVFFFSNKYLKKKPKTVVPAVKPTKKGFSPARKLSLTKLSSLSGINLPLKIFRDLIQLFLIYLEVEQLRTLNPLEHI